MSRRSTMPHLTQCEAISSDLNQRAAAVQQFLMEPPAEACRTLTIAKQA